ncbi:MAG: hypothetical protein ACTSYT_01765, partial [Candidatus Asgardarchaeia archaeon]
GKDKFLRSSKDVAELFFKASLMSKPQIDNFQDSILQDFGEKAHCLKDGMDCRYLIFLIF